ncbi:RNA 2',3'-cyclic phosphodiesterase [Marinobacter nanhaiticus D15-8W]|uniref:RNA 2',3'-cyclic phosphodiesterase n=1 Tax=Marinobacter nanhaiticus D15-8W TaxID=626887 RepID=N6W864_9GAMM|nr:RNA 2',3'-cyclic phosphodiesterase [Marinobacter nanhaiticus]ENO16484.1 RNA 2',3'-cyclic phosphodiesterase [Marinobacter nanhaiticus D15-8W]BES72273.1 RNA 2',3'-cyclic phosphodiesterase [Marinobacter nanhaiticus D15-8W]
MLRLFVGLELPNSIKHQLATLRTEISGAKWQTPEQMHLTLCFIGNVDDERLDAIYDALYGATVEPFTLAVDRLGMFGSRMHPKTLWAGVSPEAPVVQLHEDIVRCLAGIGLEPWENAYRPHITLARFRRRRSRQLVVRQDKKVESPAINQFLSQNDNLELPEFQVSHISLFSSTQRPEGSHYQIIGRFPSDGPNDPLK